MYMMSFHHQLALPKLRSWHSHSYPACTVLLFDKGDNRMNVTTHAGTQVHVNMHVVVAKLREICIITIALQAFIYI